MTLKVRKLILKILTKYVEMTRYVHKTIVVINRADLENNSNIFFLF